MTDRLYYDDAYLWSFEAAVALCVPAKKPGEWFAALDRSAFYPTSGGQPFDTGRIVFPGG
jgi:alanyl-tRNA synthetase